MFKYVRYGLAIMGLMLPLYAQAELSGLKEIDQHKRNLIPCDVSISSPLYPSSVCIGAVPVLGTYTLRNNSRVPIRLNSIFIQSRDALSTSATEIIAVPNNCQVGSLLQPGASCNVSINILPLAQTGRFNRTLKVLISNTRQTQVESLPITLSIANCVAPIPSLPPIPNDGNSPSPAPFPALFSFSILANSTITNSGPTVITGDLGLSPGTSVTGFSFSTPAGLGIVIGTPHITDAQAALGQSQAVTYYSMLASLPCTTIPTELAGQILPPGVYCSNSGTFELTGLPASPLILTGGLGSSYTFQMATTLNTLPNSSVLIPNGVSPGNINWQVGSSATIGTGTAFVGNIAALTSISFNTGATLRGRAWALGAAITLLTNVINPA